MVVSKIVVGIVVGTLFMVVSKIVVGIIGIFSISYFFISELQIPKILTGSFALPVSLNKEPKEKLEQSSIKDLFI